VAGARQLTVMTAMVVLFCGCRVDDSYLDDGLFVCAVSADCGDGWGCVRGSPYSVDFCAPDCESTCDGVCVVQGDQQQCLRSCRVRDDGTTSACEGRDFHCIRVSAEDDEGVCYPVRPCNGPADCGAGEACLSDLANAFGVSGALRTDNLYCVPAPTDPAACPARSVHTAEIFSGAAADLCIPRCDAADTRCPPGFGCLRQLGGTEEIFCLPGIYGIPCDDDTNCLLGTCIDTGAPGKFCTLSCAEANTIAFGCERLSTPISSLGLGYHLECDETAAGGNDGGLCVPRYELGAVCTTPESGVFTCALGLSCIELAGTEGLKACTFPCTLDEQCNSGEGTPLNYCNMFWGVCLPKAGEGAQCLRAEGCLSGNCTGGRCQ
jgi:hypothetical protein